MSDEKTNKQQNIRNGEKHSLRQGKEVPSNNVNDPLNAAFIVQKIEHERINLYENQVNTDDEDPCFKNSNSNKKNRHKTNCMSEMERPEKNAISDDNGISYSHLGESVDENSFVKHNFVGRFKIGRSLGTGSSCRVRLGIDPETGEKVAVKIIERETAYEDRVYREALIASLLCHPHIVPMRDFFFSKSYFYLIFEYVSGVQLLDLVLTRGPLSEKTARRFFRQIASAVSYLHNNCIVHRDLKIENILVDEHGSVKIIDFGLSNFFDKTRFLSTFCGSLYFAAPELLRGIRYIGPEIDVWSLGVVLFVLLHGRVPFDDAEVSGLHAKITQAQYEVSKKMSKPALALIHGMICREMLRRFSMQAVICSAWVNQGFSSKINDFMCERKSITELDTQLVKILSIVTRRQFPNFTAELQRYHNACLKENEFEKDYYGKRPTVSLYYLMLEKTESGKVDIHETVEALSMHNFVSFIQDKSVTASKYFLGAVFKESRFEKAATLQRTTPIIKKSVVKWIFKGIPINRIRCQYELREWVDKLLSDISAEYEVKERHYMCQRNGCNFKVSLYRNEIFRSFYLSVTKFNGCKNRFKEIVKEIRTAGCGA